MSSAPDQLDGSRDREESLAALPVEPYRRVLAAVIDLFIMPGFACAGAIVAFIFYVGNTGQDFDGPPEYDDLSNWFALGLLSIFTLVYSSCELFFAASPGKRFMQLQIAPPCLTSASTRRGARVRRLGRWVVKFAPVILLCVLGWTSYNILVRNLPWNRGQPDSTQFQQLNARLARWTLLVAAIPLGLQVIWFLVTRGEMLHDRLSGTQVVRRVRARSKRVAHGFEPIIRSAPAAAPAIKRSAT